MKRAVVVTAVVLLLVTLAEVVVLTLAEQRTSAALCDIHVDLAPPVATRVIAGRTLPFTAELDGDDLDRVVPRPDAVTTIAVEDGRLLLGTTTGLTVPAELRLDHGRLLVTPTLGPIELGGLALRIPLVDVLPIGVEVDEVTVVDDVVRVTGRADAREFTTTGATDRCPAEGVGPVS
jgi:hypothetical protein